MLSIIARVAFTGLLMALSGGLYAQVTIAYCKLGAGCKFYQTSLSYAQVDGMLNYLGTFEKEKGILVFFRNKQNQDVHYPDRKRSIKELNEYFGGKGEPNVSKGGLAPFETVIQPNDGNWEAITQTPLTKNCPPQLTSQLKGMASLKSGNRVFQKPFTPAELLPPDTPWLTTTPNVYKAILLPQSQPSIRSVYDFEVVSPQFIKGTLNVSIQIPSQPTCEVITDFTFKHQR